MSDRSHGRHQGESTAPEQTPGVSLTDVLALPAPLAQLVTWLMRHDAIGLAEVAAYLRQDEAAAQRLVTELVDRGFVQELAVGGAARYRVRPAPRRKRAVPTNLWQALDE